MKGSLKGVARIRDDGKPSILHRIIALIPSSIGPTIGMHDYAALLTRFEQIAARQCPCEERVTQALTLLGAYVARLYARLGIGASNRLVTEVKSAADRALAELRGKVLAAEVQAPESARIVFTALRQCLDMRRRVLASRIAERNGCSQQYPTAIKPNDPAEVPISANLCQDWQLIALIKHHLLDREQVARSKAAIKESINLLESGWAGRRVFRHMAL